MPEHRPALAADSRQRIAWLGCGFAGLALLVLVRCLGIHLDSGPAFRAAAERPREIREPLEARRGTIVDRRGAVLAEDRQVDVLTMHYRWLEQPPQRAWLRQRAQQSLSPLRRRDPAAVAAAMQKIEQEIRQLHQRLAREGGLSDQQWEDRRRNIQLRVERTVAAVNQRRQARYEDRQAPPAGEDHLPSRWSGLLADALRALFAPPEPLPPPPVIIREETQHHVLYGGVEPAWKARIAERPERYPGVRIEERRRRIYPHGSLAAHLVGYVSPRDPGPSTGQAGMEAAQDELLAGQPGQVIRRLTRSGEVAAEKVPQQPQPGEDVVATLDSRLQAVAERLLDDACRLRDNRHRRRHALGQTTRPAGGSIIVMDVWRGEILAMASGPRFDPNDFAQGQIHDIRRWLAEAQRAMFDRSLQMAIPPGSVFKPAVAVALLQAVDMDPAAPLICRGYLQTPDRQRCMLFRQHGIGHGPTNLSDALAQSCNVYFFHYAHQIGPEALISWAMRFGFGQRTGIDLPGEATADLPTISSVTAENSRGWDVAHSEALAIGQGRLTATPLQVVRMMAAIANGGYLVTPRVHRDQIASRPAGDRSATPAGMRIPGLQAATLAAVRHGLVRVVAAPTGTAHHTVLVPGLPLAGKTGTAQVGADQEDHAWFAGYAPADDPRYALVVVLEHGGEGSAAAGPVARQLWLT
ncbi:MAG: hypothetical protein GTO03_10710, partial [Planctomycetales bacterium]|nr:hypothetical protein [Planctomycetales bacterium]